MSRNRSMVKTLVLALTVVVLFAMPVAGAFAQDMTNGITTPADGATLSGTVEVKGYASAPDFMKWQLDVLAGGADDAAIFLAVGTNPGEFTYSLDTTAFPAGEHALRLRVVTADSNYTEYVNKFTLGAPVAAVTLPAAVAATPVVTATLPVTPTAVAVAPVAMTNGITLPKTITETATVTGYAADPNFDRWQLDVLPGGDENAAIFVATGSDSGEFEYALDTTAFPPGEHVLRMRVVRTDSNYSEYTAPLVIGSAAPAPAPVATPEPVATEAPAAAAPVEAAPAMANGITAPTEGATVSGTVEVMGHAHDPNFNRWQLDVLAGGDENAAIFVATGSTAGEFMQALDTMAFPNGEHALRLRVVRNDSNYSEYVTKFTIAN